jgi:hypothetical protein
MRTNKRARGTTNGQRFEFPIRFPFPLGKGIRG